MRVKAGIPPGGGASLAIVATSRYHRSREALGDAPEAHPIADALEATAAGAPDAGVVIPDTIVRVLHSRSYGNFPALRLYYSVAGWVVHLLWIEPYDELEGDAPGAATH